MDNYYKILGLNKNASKQEIKKSYKKLVLKYHPDKNTNDTSFIFQKIKEAFEILYDDEKRKEYDNLLNFEDNTYFDLNYYYEIILEICNEYELDEIEKKEIFTVLNINDYKNDAINYGTAFANEKLMDKLLDFIPKFTLGKLKKQYSFLAPLFNLLNF
ncbi:Dnaj-like protein [Acanthamoeba polyphaga moumouvirus]|uniref:Dnaj-like protein n=2 Tax=Moumouvirus TaxID=3080801 RepID=L7RC42_9VIRU|nr:Dnaj-like protein [Acanthamoeba polyphaga moumouvirus]AEX62950.1 putative J domain-containing protein [Moumouvirus Monve]AGC01832.1 Dnaj-like protein [Acanthamoeba polyphaga moumouvirus]AQN68189.1 dnaj-like protein [Saudi moumouvirus]